MTNWRPPYPYIPGKTARHPEDLFDAIKSSADGLSVKGIRASAAWKAGLTYLDEGFFWEAHEVLEAVWMVCPPNAAEKLMVQAIIQTANAKLKRVMGRENAYRRLERQSCRLAQEAVMRANGPVLGFSSLDVYYNA